MLSRLLVGEAQAEEETGENLKVSQGSCYKLSPIPLRAKTFVLVYMVFGRGANHDDEKCVCGDKVRFFFVCYIYTFSVAIIWYLSRKKSKWSFDFSPVAKHEEERYG